MKKLKSFARKIDTLRALILSSVLLTSTSVKSQVIDSPDTVTVGSVVDFGITGDYKFYSYAWEFETNTFTPLLTQPVEIPNTGTAGYKFDISSNATMIYDDKTKSYYAFVTCASTGFSNPNVQRIDFGNNPHNPNPATVDLGNPGNAFVTNANGYHNIQDFKLAKDNAGIFHAFINNGGIIHWTFGNGLNNPPTQSVRIFTDASILGMSMNMAVIHYNNSWHIFTGQTFGISPGLVRLDLGADLNNIPSTIPYNVFPAASGTNDIATIAILKQNNNWFAYMTDQDGGSSLIKFAFGTDLLNNNPTITNSGPANTTGGFNRGLNFLKTCDTTLLVGLQQNGYVYSYDFMNNNVDNTPNQHNYGQKFGNNAAMQDFNPYWNNDTLWALTTNYISTPGNTVYRFPLAAITSGNTVVNYYNATATHTFNTVGVYEVNVYCDQAENKGPQSFCKQIVVKEATTAISNIEDNESLKIYPNPLSEDRLNVTAPKSGKLNYTLTSILGQTILTASVNVTKGQTLTIDIPQNTVSKGVYCLTLLYNDGPRFTAKIVRN